MTNVLSALFYLRVTSLQNAVVSRFKRLKQPKYLIGAIVGIAYIYFAYYRRFSANRGARSAMLNGALTTDALQTILAIGAIILTVVFALCWVWPRARASLNFKEAEIAFLFPAPVSRRALIHYRLVNSQTGLLFTALIVSFFSNGWSFLQGNFLIRIVGWWIIFATLSLHVMGSSFVITRLLDSGVTSRRRQLMALGIAAIIVVAIWRTAPVPHAEDFANYPAFASYVSTLVADVPLSWLILPASWVLAPMFAADVRAFLIALGPALLVYAVHYIWILQAEVSFEEASIVKAEKRAARVAAMREGKYRVSRSAPKARREPFKLALVKRPELAFLWKNLLSTAEYLRPRTALITAAIIAIGCTWLTNHAEYRGLRTAIGLIAMTIGGYLLVLGPQLARQDLRSDLLNADILKIYPLRGWQIVLGEILTPVAIVTVLLWLAILTIALTFEPRRMEWLTPQLRAAIAIGLALVAPFLCMMQLLVINTAAILFPAWMQTSRGRGSSGIEVMGQRLFFLAGQLFVIIVALIPASLVAALIYSVAQWIVGIPLATVFASAAILVILAAEIALVTRWLGTRFERFDLSAELRP